MAILFTCITYITWYIRLSLCFDFTQKPFGAGQFARKVVPLTVVTGFMALQSASGFQVDFCLLSSKVPLTCGRGITEKKFAGVAVNVRNPAVRVEGS